MRRIRSLIVALVVGALPVGADAATTCPAPLTVAEASRLQMAWFHSLATLDRVAYDRLTTPDFMVYELGKANSRDEEFDFFKRLIGAGNHANWSVTEPHLQADCDVAVMHYRDVGEVKTGAGAPVPMQWLEVVTFRRTGRVWRLSFQSSMRDASFDKVAVPLRERRGD